MKVLKFLPLLFIFLTQFSFTQIPCSSGFTANGTNDFIQVPNTDAINLQNTRNRTIEFWFKSSDISTRQIMYEEGAQVNAILIYLEGGRVYLGGFRNNADTSVGRRMFRSAVGDISVDTWYHIAFTVEDTATPDVTFKWFLNGVEQDEQAGCQINIHSGDVSIGRNGGLRFPNNWTNTASLTYNGTFGGQDNNEYFYSGNISLFRIWNVARTETQINTNKSTYLTSGTSLVAYQNGDTIEYEANGTNSIGATATANGSATSYTWSGATSTSFTDNSNWSGTSPDLTKTQTVIIGSGANNPSITTEVKVGRLTVNTGAEIIVQSGATLNVFYELTNNGTITVEDGGALIFNSCNSTITGSGTFNIKRATPTYSGVKFYSYWSSPVIPTDSNIATVFPDANLIYKFNASAANSEWAFNGASNFDKGVGYAVRNEGLGGQLRTFSGKINEGNVVVNIFNTSNKSGADNNGAVWSTSGDNLVGNPYPSAIDWDLIITDTDNSNVEGTIFFWNQNSAEIGENNVSDYLYYNATGGTSPGITGKIGTGQGFFVRTTTDATITFKTSHQIVANNTQFYKSTKKKKISKNLDGRSWFYLNHEDKRNIILVGFVKNATNRYDRLYDAPFNINQKSLGFYSIVRGNKKASIQGLPELKRNKRVVKIGFIVDKLGDYTFGVKQEHISEDYYIYLRDTELKKTIDLRKNAYNFKVDSIGENNTRFKLIYTKKKRKVSKGVNKSAQQEVVEIDSQDFSVYVDEARELIVEYDYDVDNVNEVSVFDIQGRKVANFTGSQQKIISNLSEGIYIVKAFLENNTIMSKKIVIAN